MPSMTKNVDPTAPTSAEESSSTSSQVVQMGQDPTGGDDGILPPDYRARVTVEPAASSSILKRQRSCGLHDDDDCIVAPDHHCKTAIEPVELPSTLNLKRQRTHVSVDGGMLKDPEFMSATLTRNDSQLVLAMSPHAATPGPTFTFDVIDQKVLLLPQEAVALADNSGSMGSANMGVAKLLDGSGGDISSSVVELANVKCAADGTTLEALSTLPRINAQNMFYETLCGSQGYTASNGGDTVDQVDVVGCGDPEEGEVVEGNGRKLGMYLKEAFLFAYEAKQVFTAKALTSLTADGNSTNLERAFGQVLKTTSNDDHVFIVTTDDKLPQALSYKDLFTESKRQRIFIVVGFTSYDPLLDPNSKGTALQMATNMSYRSRRSQMGRRVTSADTKPGCSTMALSFGVEFLTPEEYLTFGVQIDAPFSADDLERARDVLHRGAGIMRVPDKLAICGGVTPQEAATVTKALLRKLSTSGVEYEQVHNPTDMSFIVRAGGRAAVLPPGSSNWIPRLPGGPAVVMCEAGKQK